MVEQFRAHILENLSLLIGKKLIVACSGGLDSVVLAELLRLCEFDFTLAHCNFSLRGKESDDDESFVIGLAKKMDVPVFVERFDTRRHAKKNRLSIQLAARELRYAWFDHLLNSFSYDYLLTAHHQDDNLETFFINLSRGTGLRGLTGIPEINDRIIRPLLPFSKEEIRQFADENNLKWREDSSNRDTDYLRNKLRIEVIPSLKESVPTVLKTFANTQKHLIASQKLLDDYLTLIYKLVLTTHDTHSSIDITALKALPNYRELLYELLSGFGFTEWNDVIKLLDAQTGKRVFSKTHELLKNRDELLLSPIAYDSNVVYPVPEKGIVSPIILKISLVDHIDAINPNMIYADADKLDFPLTLKHWDEGEEFYPFGMTGKKKLSKFFKDEKLSLIAKKNLWVLYNNRDVVWVVGLRMDNRFRVTDKTRQIIKIEVQEL